MNKYIPIGNIILDVLMALMTSEFENDLSHENQEQSYENINPTPNNIDDLVSI